MAKYNATVHTQRTLNKRKSIMVTLLLFVKEFIEAIRRSLNQGYLRSLIEALRRSCKHGYIRAIGEALCISFLGLAKEIRQVIIISFNGFLKAVNEARNVNLSGTFKTLGECTTIQKRIDNSFDGFFGGIAEATVMCVLAVSAGSLFTAYYFFYMMVSVIIIVIFMTMYDRYNYLRYQYQFVQAKLRERRFKRLECANKEIEKLEKTKECDSLQAIKSYKEKLGNVVEMLRSANKRPVSMTTMEGYVSLTTPKNTEKVEKQLFDMWTSCRTIKQEEKFLFKGGKCTSV